jgi:hypothetical protein
LPHNDYERLAAITGLLLDHAPTGSNSAILAVRDVKSPYRKVTAHQKLKSRQSLNPDGLEEFLGFTASRESLPIPIQGFNGQTN